MKIEEIIRQSAELRDAVKSLVSESKAAAPHLCNAAGALHTAITNLEGHMAAEKARPAKPQTPDAKPQTP
jgi:hypothetical protein